MSWITDVYAAVQKIVLIEERLENVSSQVQALSAQQVDFDRRLIRLEAKFELLERMAAPSRRALPEKSET